MQNNPVQLISKLSLKNCKQVLTTRGNLERHANNWAWEYIIVLNYIIRPETLIKQHNNLKCNRNSDEWAKLQPEGPYLDLISAYFY